MSTSRDFISTPVQQSAGHALSEAAERARGAGSRHGISRSEMGRSILVSAICLMLLLIQGSGAHEHVRYVGSDSSQTVSGIVRTLALAWSGTHQVAHADRGETDVAAAWVSATRATDTHHVVIPDLAVASPAVSEEPEIKPVLVCSPSPVPRQTGCYFIPFARGPPSLV